MTIVVPLADQQKIRSVILNDEGGFIFDRDSSQETDPDGGWTFAGCTRNNWEGYFKATAPISYEAMRAFVNQNPQTVEAMVIEIYYIEYAKVLKDNIGAGYDIFELSCAVNRGPQNALKAWTIASSTVGTGHESNWQSLYKTAFLQQWMLQYIQLVQDNSLAWKQYALSGRPSDRPKTFRAANLKGWFNRVEHYR